MAHADAGTWLLISTSDAADLLATKLTDALKLAWRAMHDDVRGHCAPTIWPSPNGWRSPAHRRLHRRGRPDAAPPNGDPEEQCALRGRE